MKINTKIRIEVLKYMIARYELLLSEINPYGFDSANAMKYYNLINYWEDKLQQLIKALEE
jgi:hypothetical protein